MRREAKQTSVPASCRRRARGTPPEPALVTAMGKLLTILNAILRDQESWQGA
jgi:hypothetical protein